MVTGILSKNRILFFILIAGLAARIFLIIFFHDHRALFYDADSHEYIALAENMRLGHGFSWDSAEPYQPNSFRTPVYPGFLFLSRFLFGSYAAALVVQAILMFLSGWLLYTIGMEFLKNKKIALWSAGVFLFMPFSLNVSVKFLTQTLFAFLLILSVWSWTEFLKSQKKSYFLLTSFLLPVLALTRPIAQYIPAVFIFSLACAAYLKQTNLSFGRLLKLTGIMLGIFLAVSLPWLVRNYKTFGAFEFSSIVPYQLYFYELPDTYALAKGVSYQEASDFLKKDINNYSKNDNLDRYMEFSSRGVLLERSRYYLSRYPFYAALSRIKNSAKFFLRDGIRYWYNDFDRSKRVDVDVYKIVTLKEKNLFPYLVAVERLFLAVLFMGMLVSAVYILRGNPATRLLSMFLFSLLAYFPILTGVMASAGLRFPVEPIFVLMGLSGIYKLLFLKNGKKQSPSQ